MYQICDFPGIQISLDIHSGSEFQIWDLYLVTQLNWKLKLNTHPLSSIHNICEYFYITIKFNLVVFKKFMFPIFVTYVPDSRFYRIPDFSKFWKSGMDIRNHP